MHSCLSDAVAHVALHDATDHNTRHLHQTTGPISDIHQNTATNLDHVNPTLLLLVVNAVVLQWKLNNMLS